MFIRMDLHLVILTCLWRGFSRPKIRIFEYLKFKFMVGFFFEIGRKIVYSWLADSSSGTGTRVILNAVVLLMATCQLPCGLVGRIFARTHLRLVRGFKVKP
jgi:hypothetical protein